MAAPVTDHERLHRLDADVAEKVMGIHRHKHQLTYESEGVQEWICREPSCPGGSVVYTKPGDPIGLIEQFWHGGRCQVEPYSSDPAASAALKRRLREAGIHFRIEPWHLGGAEGAKSIGVFLLDSKKRGSSSHWLSTCLGVRATTEEEAMCRFAMACIELNVLPGVKKDG